MAQSENLLFMQNPELAQALRRRRMGEALMQQGSDASPIASPWQGVARLAQALVGGYEQGQADKEIKGAGERRQAMLAQLLADDSPAPAMQMPAAPAMTAPPPAPVSRAPLAPPDLAPFIEAEAKARGIPPSLATSLFATESSFNPQARNPRSGAFGIGQVLASTAANPGFGMQPITEADLADPRKAIPWSLDYLKARGGALGVTDFNDPQQAGRALRAYGENTDEYERKVLGGAGMLPQAGQGVQVAGPGAPPAAAQQGQPDYLGMAQRLQQRAQAAAAMGETALAQQFQNQAVTYRQLAMQRQPQPTEAERIALAAGLQPGTPQYQEAMRAILAGKASGQVTNITMPPQTQTGPIPQGFQLRSVDGVLRMEPIPGGPADKKATGEQKKEDLRDAQVGRAANIVLEDIDRIGKTVDGAFFPATGLGATTLSGIPGTAAHDVAKLLDGIKANVAFDKLQQMREASPTGGALGAVSDREMALLQSVLGSLEQSQSPRQFQENLGRLKTVYLDIIHGAGKWREGPASDVTPAATPPQGAGPRVIEYDASGRRVAR